MKNGFGTRKKTDIMKLTYIFLLLILTVSITFLIFGMADYKAKYDETSIKHVKTAIFDSLITCYSLEGRYPDDLDHLVKNYGLILNDAKYIYHYEIMGSNILPEYDVIRYYKNDKKGSAFFYQEEDGS